MTFELTIDALAQGGQGVGRYGGKVVFVPFTAPGDRVHCRTVRDRGRFAEAEAGELLTAGPGRRVPACPVFGVCGGCQWQHLEYASQAEWKHRLFAEQFSRTPALGDVSPEPLLTAPREWGYRSRVQFKCRQTDHGFVMGFYRRGSHFVVDVAACPVATPEVNRALAALRAWLPESPCPGKIPQVDVENGADGALRVVVHCLDRASRRLADYLRPLAAGCGMALYLQTGRKRTLSPVTGDEALKVTVDDPALELAYGPGGFAQVNQEQNRRLVAEVVAARDWSGSERVLDLFCGMGNLSLPLARRAGSVTGVEAYPPSIAWARRNARRLGLGNAVFHAAPAEGALERFFPEVPPDLLVLDPPRSGAFAVCRELRQKRVEHLLYISCNPATLVRDLVPLVHGGYRLLRARPLDFFPQTSHVESLTLLARRG